MATSFKVSKTDPTIKRLIAATFPSYRGRTVRVDVATTVWVRDYWDGGTREYARFVGLESGKVAPVPGAGMGPMYVKGAQHSDSVPLPEGIVLVTHTIFCGRDVGLRITVHPANVAGLVPDAHSLALTGGA